MEGKVVQAGLTAEEWLKMWDSGFSHDHAQETEHLHQGDDGNHHHHDEEDSCHDTETEEISGVKLRVSSHLKRNFPRLTEGSTGKTILVSLCGDSPDMEWLCFKGYSVVGVEVSETAVKKFFEKTSIPFDVTTDGNAKVYSATDGKKLKVYVGNFFDESISPSKIGSFDYIWDAHGIVALPREQQEPYAKKLGTFVKPKGKILYSTVEYDVTKLEEGPAPSLVSMPMLQEFYPESSQVELLENELLEPGQLKGVDEWSNPIVLITFN